MAGAVADVPVGSGPVAGTAPAGTDATGSAGAADPAPASSAPDDIEASAPAAPNPTPLSAGTYLIRPACSNTRVLDIAAGSKADGAALQLYASNMSPAQVFAVSFDADGNYTIKNTGSGKLLDLQASSAKAGTSVVQNKANSTDAQKWVVEASGDGYRLKSAISTTSDLVLDISGAADKDGTKAVVYTANNTAAQRFYFIPFADAPAVPNDATVATGIYTIATALSGSPVVDVPGNTDEAGAQLGIWSSNNTLAQKFVITLEPDGYYSIRGLQSALYLDISIGNLVAGGVVCQWAATGYSNQRWAVKANSDGTVTFLSKRSGLALDVIGANSAPGTKLNQWYPNGTTAQKFKLQPATADLLNEGCFALVPLTQKGLRADITGASRNDGENLQAYASNDSIAQKFQVKRVGTDTYTFQSINSGRYLTARDGNVVQAGPAGGTPNNAQQWRAVPAMGGFALVNKSTGQAMALTPGGSAGSASRDIRLASLSGTSPYIGGAQVFRVYDVAALNNGMYLITSRHGQRIAEANDRTHNGANIQLDGTNNSAGQKWTLSYLSGEYFTLRCPRSSRAVDISSNLTKPGTNVSLWDYHAGDGQRFRAVPSGDGWFYLQSPSGMYLSGTGGGNYPGSNLVVTNNISAAVAFRFSPTSYSGPTGTYVDVNLTTQRLQFIKDGILAVDCDVVTGAPWMVTPTGNWKVMVKQSPTTLSGPGYNTPVKYWMQITPSGVGLHDAWWQPTFGGNWYKNHGSHGCINMPEWAARDVYRLIRVGDPVYVHH